MMFSGSSSLLAIKLNSWLVVLGLVLCVICYLFYRQAKSVRVFVKFNFILSLVFLAGQGLFLYAMLSTAAKYNVHVSLPQSLKTKENNLTPQDSASYLTIYNEKQWLDIYFPQSKQAKPSVPVIFVHGGGFIEGNRKQTGNTLKWFTVHGCTVFSIDYPLGKTDRQTWESAVNAVATSMSFVIKNAQKFDVDAQKIVLIGSSAGGALVMQADEGLREGFVKAYDSLQPSPPAAVIAIYPPVSLSELWKKMEEGKTVDLRNAARKYIGGTPLQFPARFRQLNLIDQLSNSISPTLIIAGAADHVVNIEATRTFFEKTKKDNLPVQYIEIPYGEHGFDTNSNSIAGQIKWNKIEAFLKQQKLLN